MRSLKTTTASNTVEVRSLIHLYVTTLEARGYRPSVIGAYRAAVEHFVSWAAPDGDCVQVSKAAVRDFLNVHLGDCKCRAHPARSRDGPFGVEPPVDGPWWKQTGIRGAVVRTPRHQLQKFCEYASDVCGLAPATLISRRQWIGRFLAHQFPKGSIEVSRLSPKQIRGLLLFPVSQLPTGHCTGDCLRHSQLSTVPGFATCRSSRVPSGSGSFGGVLATGGSAPVLGDGRSRLAYGRVRLNPASTSA